MNSIVVKLSLGDTSGRDSSGQTRDVSFSVTPAAAPFAWGVRVS
jgi:hypothetical protein